MPSLYITLLTEGVEFPRFARLSAIFVARSSAPLLQKCPWAGQRSWQ